MNLYVTCSATSVLRILIVRRTSRLIRPNSMVYAVTRQAQMIHGAELQHSRIRRPVRHVTRHAAVGLHGSVFEGKWTLLIGVALEACCVSANRQPCLF